MVMVLPPIAAVSVAGGLAGGGLGAGVWAERVAAAIRRLQQARSVFIAMFLLGAESLVGNRRRQPDDCRTARPGSGTGPIAGTLPFDLVPLLLGRTILRFLLPEGSVRI